MKDSIFLNGGLRWNFCGLGFELYGAPPGLALVMLGLWWDLGLLGSGLTLSRVLEITLNPKP